MTPSTRPADRELFLPKLWLLYSALCTLIGWVLSAVRGLTAVGWIIAALALGGVTWWVVKPIERLGWEALWARCRRRLRQPLPLLFGIIVAVTILRGLANPEQETGDVISYRVPRMLDWMFAHGWHWISTFDARFNGRGTGAEWMAMPFLLLTRSEHFSFIVTLVSFALMPGLVYVVYRELGVARRVAWWWAWIGPTGCCYLFQAGTFSTDGMGAFYSLAAVGFALRARRRGSFALLGYSILAAALMTNQKASNLPLLLPIFAAWAYNLPLLRTHAVRTAACCVIGAAVSFLPIGAANFAHGNGFLGLKAEQFIPPPPPPVVSLGFNLIFVGAHALLPPIVSPGTDLPNLVDLTRSSALKEYTRTHFETHYGDLPRIMNEDLCGLGLGVTALLIATWFFRRGPRRLTGMDAARVVRWCIWMALFAVCAKATLVAITRVLAPYYLLLLPTFLLGTGAERAVRALLWKRLAALQSLACIGVLFTLTSTPPWPMLTGVAWLEKLERRFPNHPAIRKIIYIYETGPKGLAFWNEVGAQLPADEKVFGLIRAWDSPELGFWKPIGSRRIEHVLHDDNHESLRARGIRHVLVLRYQSETIEQLEERLGADLERDFVFTHPHHAGHLVQMFKLR